MTSPARPRRWPIGPIGPIIVLGVLAVLAVMLGMRIKALVDPPAGVARVQAANGEMTVAAAYSGAPPDKSVVVRGYVFAGDGFPARICDGLRRTSPPQCMGPFLLLRNLDPSRVYVTTKKAKNGKSVIWSPEPVALLGRGSGDTFTVEQIVN